MSEIKQSTIGDFDAMSRFSELLTRVEGGEEVTITRNGMPVARMLPVQPKTAREQRRAAIEAMRELAKHNTLGSLRIKDLIAEGRR